MRMCSGDLNTGKGGWKERNPVNYIRTTERDNSMFHNVLNGRLQVKER